MTQLDLRRRIVRYLIECDQSEKISFTRPAWIFTKHADNDAYEKAIYETADLCVYGILEQSRDHEDCYVSIRNLSDAEQWLIDTMPRTPAEQE